MGGMRRSFLALAACLLTTCSAQQTQLINNTANEIYWSDGDSGRLDGVKFRLANVDAPETGGVGARGGAKCEAERALGYEAKAFMVDFTRTAELQITQEYGTDRYDRLVVDLAVNGRDLGDAGVEAAQRTGDEAVPVE